MNLSRPVTDVMKRRFSCRSYREEPLADIERERLSAFLSSLTKGPLGTPVRFGMIAATEQDRQSLKGLGTYGFIKKPAGFIIGAAAPAVKDLEDYGYMMEMAVLCATDIGLGSCWLGGTFTKRRFARKISAQPGELVPAVASIGHIADRGILEGRLRRMVDADNRLPWTSLFFRDRFGVALSREDAGAYALPLDMVRIGPSASNKQPWRIIQSGNTCHFYLQRTPGYGNSFAFKLLGLADLQRVDMGIAMCHFALTTARLGAQGKWVVAEPEIEKPDKMTEYAASWTGASSWPAQA
jgi:hypothetical protein